MSKDYRIQYGLGERFWLGVGLFYILAMQLDVIGNDNW